MSAVVRDERTDVAAWLRMVDELAAEPTWEPDPFPIEVVRTHISVVLLGRQHALKLKKPVDFGFLDYTTVERRRRACEAEVALNRRLCPDVYLGVVPIARIEGRPRVGAPGPPIDFAVLMRRLPEDRMLGAILARGEATESTIDAIAECVSAFHYTAARGPAVAVHGSPETIAHNWDENFVQVEPFVGRTIARETFDRVRAWVEERRNSLDGLFRARARDGWIRDGHGDVRCDSICVADRVYVFDCVEFNDRFRCGDVASEVAFLSSDLAARGRADLGYLFCERYGERSGDPDLFRLLPFYRCYRAFVRGKVASFQVDQDELDEAAREAAASCARAVFARAARYASPLGRRAVVAVGGLSGTGKTSVARATAEELGLRVVSSDAVRKALFGRGLAGTPYGRGAYGPEANAATYRAVLDRGRDLLSSDGAVVLDATFRRPADREAARALAVAAGAEWRVVECVLPERLVRERLERRARLGDGLSDATWDTYVRQRDEVETAGADDRDARYVCDTSGSLEEVARGVAQWLRRGAQEVWR